MADALLRREIKRLVEEQKALNQRLQRKPPGAPGPLGPRPIGEGPAPGAAAPASAGDAAAERPEKRPQASLFD